MTLILCTMPQCQTSAGCICERQLRPTRTTPTPHSQALDSARIQLQGAADLLRRDGSALISVPMSLAEIEAVLFAITVGRAAP